MMLKRFGADQALLGAPSTSRVRSHAGRLRVA